MLLAYVDCLFFLKLRFSWFLVDEWFFNGNLDIWRIMLENSGLIKIFWFSRSLHQYSDGEGGTASLLPGRGWSLGFSLGFPWHLGERNSLLLQGWEFRTSSRLPLISPRWEAQGCLIIASHMSSNKTIMVVSLSLGSGESLDFVLGFFRRHLNRCFITTNLGNLPI